MYRHSNKMRNILLKVGNGLHGNRIRHICINDREQLINIYKYKFTGKWELSKWRDGASYLLPCNFALFSFPPLSLNYSSHSQVISSFQNAWAVIKAFLRDKFILVFRLVHHDAFQRILFFWPFADTNDPNVLAQSDEPLASFRSCRRFLNLLN